MLAERQSQLAVLHQRGELNEKTQNDIRAQLMLAKESGLHFRKQLGENEVNFERSYRVSNRGQHHIQESQAFQESQKRAALLQQQISSLAARAKDVGNDLSRGTQAISSIRGGRGTTMAEVDRLAFSLPTGDDTRSNARSQAWTALEPGSVSGDNFSKSDIRARIDQLEMSVNNIALGNDVLAKKIQQIPGSSRLNLSHLTMEERRRHAHKLEEDI